jgi:type III restriction enzyme
MPEETREIIFKSMLNGAIDHTVHLDGTGPGGYRSVVAYFARPLLSELRLVGGYDILYGKVKEFVRENLFETSPVDLDDPVVLRNLSEPEVGKVLFDSFKLAMNSLTIQERGTTVIEDRIRVSQARPFTTDNRPFRTTRKSVFNRIVAEPHSGGLELAFAEFLDSAPDVKSFTKNYYAVGFRIDYVREGAAAGRRDGSASEDHAGAAAWA